MNLCSIASNSTVTFSLLEIKSFNAFTTSEFWRSSVLRAHCSTRCAYGSALTSKTRLHHAYGDLADWGSAGCVCRF
jgi:hypothetical protein